jgi:XTP/dITP diphosphohydrolase
MMRIVLASRNAGKLTELKALLAHLPLTLESQAAHNVPSAEETGLTFIENALIKARAVCQATALAALADDSGLVVPALGGQPGIHSARFAGEHGDDRANNSKLVSALEHVQDRTAYFYCAMVLMRYTSDPTPIIATAAWHGQVVDQPVGDQGFGYDPHFFLPGLGQTSAQLPPQQKNKLSHRGQAAAKLLAQLQQIL